MFLCGAGGGDSSKKLMFYEDLKRPNLAHAYVDVGLCIHVR